MDEWQEIERLKGRLRAISDRATRQSATLTNHPKIRCGDIVADRYAVQERTVENAKEEVYTDVEVLPGDPGIQAADTPVEFAVDENGERYILPEAQRTIAVEDQDGTDGKRCEVSSAGVVTVPDGESARNIVVVENAGNFHSGYSLKSGRVYLGQRNGNSYLASLQGFGDGIETDIDIGLGDLTIEHDTAGHILEVSFVIGYVPLTQLWFYQQSLTHYYEGTWHQITYANDGPCDRYAASVFYRNTLIYVLGGIATQTGVVCSDFWQGSVSDISWTVTWTQLDDPPFGATAYMSTFDNRGYGHLCLGGINAAKAKTNKFWYYTFPGWTQYADCPISLAGASITFLQGILIDGTPSDGLAVVDSTDHQNPVFWKWGSTWETPDAIWSYPSASPPDTDDEHYYQWTVNNSFYETPSHRTWVLSNYINGGGTYYGYSAYRVYNRSGAMGYEQHAYTFDENNYFLNELTTNAGVARLRSSTGASCLHVFGGLRSGELTNRMFEVHPTANAEIEETYLTDDVPEARKDCALVYRSPYAGGFVYGGRI